MNWKYGGVVPRLEPRPQQIALLRETDSVNAVMINAHHVSQFLNRGIDDDDLATNTIITTTFADDQLEYWFPDRVLAVAKEFSADAVVPCDRPAYRGDAKSFRRETVKNYAADIADETPRFRKAGIDVIPLVKGETPHERRLCYDVFRDYNITQIADYCGQFFTYGYRFPALLDRVQTIALEYEPEDMMLIGLQSENLLSKLPPCVSAATGQRWLRQVNFADGPTIAVVRSLEQWVDEVETALNTGQVPLQAFTDSRGVA